MKKNIYSNNTDKTHIALLAVEKRLTKFQNKLPIELQKTFNRVHDAVIQLLLKSYIGELIENNPKIQNDLTIIIITAICNVKEKTTSEQTLKKLSAIHKIAFDKLQREIRALRRTREKLN